MSAEPTAPCIFCRLSKGEVTDQEVLTRDEELFVIRDIRPHAQQHLLVIPHQHLPSPAELDGSHSELVRRMEALGRSVLQQRLGKAPSEAEVRLGFHWPPLLSVKHLHLHVLHPASRMSWLSRWLVFRHSRFFVSPQSLLERMAKMGGGEGK